jgi:hypothetical protein
MEGLSGSHIALICIAIIAVLFFLRTSVFISTEGFKSPALQSLKRTNGRESYGYFNLGGGSKEGITYAKNKRVGEPFDYESFGGLTHGAAMAREGFSNDFPLPQIKYNLYEQFPDYAPKEPSFAPPYVGYSQYQQ